MGIWISPYDLSMETGLAIVLLVDWLFIMYSLVTMERVTGAIYFAFVLLLAAAPLLALDTLL